MKEQTLEDKLRELSLDELNKWTIHAIATSEAHKGKTISDETRHKLSEAKKGSKVTAETKHKISEANKGRKISAETRAKISEANQGLGRGRKLSAETKAKISDKMSKIKRVLNEAQILEMKRKYATGEYSFRTLGEEYGLSSSAAHNYIKKR
jgi:hypothetical protein